MTFVLSKVLYFIIQPTNWIAFLLLYGIFGKNSLRKRRSFIAATVIFLFFTNHFIFNCFANWWDYDAQPVASIEQVYDIGILLGGYSNFNILPQDDRHNFSPRGNRFTHTYELYVQKKINKILLTGGSGNVLGEKVSEAKMTKELLLRLGVPEEDIIVEPDSRNTYENAVFTKRILEKDYPNATCLLITSAFHMRRSIACFKKAGVQFKPYSVDFIGERIQIHPESMIIPDKHGFYNWELLIKEWIGYVVYKLKGYL